MPDISRDDGYDPDRWDWPPRSRLDGSALGGSAFVGGFKSGNRGFEVAHRALRSSVRRLDLSVHQVSPEDVGRLPGFGRSPREIAASARWITRTH